MAEFEDGRRKLQRVMDPSRSEFWRLNDQLLQGAQASQISDAVPRREEEMQSFGSLAPMNIPAMSPENPMMKQGMQMMQLAQSMQRPGAGGGQPGGMPQGLLARLLNPKAPAGAPTDLAPPGMQPNGNGAPMMPGFMQAGLLGKLFPQLIGAGGGAAGAGGAPMPEVPASNMPPIY